MHSGESTIDHHGEVIHRHRDATVTRSIKFLLLLRVTWRKILLLLEPPVWQHLPHTETLCLLKGWRTLPVHHKSSGLCRMGTESTRWWCVHDSIRSFIRLRFEVSRDLREGCVRTDDARSCGWLRNALAFHHLLFLLFLHHGQLDFSLSSFIDVVDVHQVLQSPFEFGFGLLLLCR